MDSKEKRLQDVAIRIVPSRKDDISQSNQKEGWVTPAPHLRCGSFHLGLKTESQKIQFLAESLHEYFIGRVSKQQH